MLQFEVFVGEGLGSVDAGAAAAVSEHEVASLDHEVFDLGTSSRSAQFWRLSNALAVDGKL